MIEPVPLQGMLEVELQPRFAQQGQELVLEKLEVRGKVRLVPVLGISAGGSLLTRPSQLEDAPEEIQPRQFVRLRLFLHLLGVEVVEAFDLPLLVLEALELPVHTLPLQGIRGRSENRLELPDETIEPLQLLFRRHRSS